MFGKKTAEDVLKLINSLSDDEKAKLMQSIGAAEETAASDDKGETPEEGAEEKAEETEEVEETVEETEEVEKTEETEDGEKVEEKVEETEEIKEELEDKDDAEKQAALAARIDALESSLNERLAAVESFIETIKSEDEKEKGDLGFQRAEQAKANAQKTYHELRKEIIGV